MRFSKRRGFSPVSSAVEGFLLYCCPERRTQGRCVNSRWSIKSQFLGESFMSTATPTTGKHSTPLAENKHLLRWVEKMAAMTKPAAIHWVDGSQEEYDQLCADLVANGTFTMLDEKLWPGCFYARSDAGDVARVEDRTFICSLSKDNAGPTNNWEDPFTMRKKLKALFKGCMQGRTMYVLPYSMGPIGSPMSRIGVQL